MTNPYRLQDGGVLVLDKEGNIVKVAPDDARCVVPDGGRVRVPIFMMDSARKQSTPTFDASHHMPRAGVPSMNDQARKAASHHNMVKRLNDAWKSDPHPGMPESNEAYHRSVARMSTANPKAPDDWVEPEKAHKRMRERIEGAWKNPPKR